MRRVRARAPHIEITYRVSLVLGILEPPVPVVKRLSLDGQLQIALPYTLRHDLQLQLQVTAVLLRTSQVITGHHRSHTLRHDLQLQLQVTAVLL